MVLRLPDPIHPASKYKPVKIHHFVKVSINIREEVYLHTFHGSNPTQISTCWLRLLSCGAQTSLSTMVMTHMHLYQVLSIIVCTAKQVFRMNL